MYRSYFAKQFNNFTTLLLVLQYCLFHLLHIWQYIAGLFVVTLLVFIGAVKCYLRCKACSGVPQMTDCDHITACRDYEECYTKRIVGTLGNLLYESGCMNKSVCSFVHTGKRNTDNRRDSVTCMQCCNTDICNNHLCSANPVFNTHLTECFSCNDILRPEDCTYLTTCGQDYQCSTSKYLLSTSGELRYRLGCSRNEACTVLNSYESTQEYCVRCCNKSYCNTQLCGFLDSAKPSFATKPQDRYVRINDSIALHCRPMTISGLPVNVTWTHEIANHTITTPSVLYLENNETVNMTVTKDHYGLWTCTLTNKYGAVSTTSTVLPPSPNFG